MHVKEKILLDRKGLTEHGPINVVIFGDSVSHGAVVGYIDYENVYWNQLKRKLNAFRDYMPVNMINASIGGPLRGLQISGGIKGGIIPGLLEMANGRFFRGIGKMLKG